MANSMLSGKDWWHKNQAKYPNSREVSDLEPGFRSRVEEFIAALEHAAATVRVNSTLRNASRAHLMHYSWKVAYGDIDPADVPQRAGVQIVWDHGNLDDSRAAARDMVQLFGMAHIASLTSNHIKGKAIDMNIDWKGTLVITKPAPLLVRIESQPRTGQNRELHRIGGETFGVRKLISDPPHWSHNGK
jgi:hypothetical protein